MKYKFITQPLIESVVVIKAGMRFKLDGTEYILAQVQAQRYALINLWDGNRFRDPASLEEVATVLNERGFVLVP